MVKLYSTHCPMCKVIEKKLDMKGIEYECIDDKDEVVNFGLEHNIKSAPILVVDNQIFDMKSANEWIKNN